MRRLLLRRGMSRVEMSLILGATGAAGYLLQRAAPRAHSIGEAWRVVMSD